MKRVCITILSLFLLFSMCGCTIVPEEGADIWPRLAYGTVQVLEQTSDMEESSYRIGAGLPGTNFSRIGQTLADKIKQEWNEYDSRTADQRLLSSHAWGTIYIKTDTWDECEDAIGFRVNNPLESLEWLSKTGYFGMESADPDHPVSHVEVTAYAARALSSLRITAGYHTEKVKVTLDATLHATNETYTMGYLYKGYVTYEQNYVSTGSGIPVLIVTSDVANNTGYYLSDFFTQIAYWVKDNVFYTLRVGGEKINQTEIQAALERILEEI